jgi:hypothetical protein
MVINRMHARHLNLLVMIAVVAGCSKSNPEIAPVTGRITLDGQPVANTDIAFYPEAQGKSPSAARTDKDGNYELGYKRGVMGGMIGDNIIRISTSPEIVRGPNRYHENYNANSQLHREVKSGKNVIDFDLKSDGSSK